MAAGVELEGNSFSSREARSPPMTPVDAAPRLPEEFGRRAILGPPTASDRNVNLKVTLNAKRNASALFGWRSDL